MNKLSAYKKIIYYALLDALGPGAVVDLRLHHHDTAKCAQLIQDGQGDYDYYVVMPHFYDQITAPAQSVNIRSLLSDIPASKLVLLDKGLPDLKGDYIAVYQQFDNDLYEALESGSDLLEKYGKLVLIFPGDVRYPTEIIQGFRSYAVHYKKNFSVLATTVNNTIEPGTAYVVLEDSDLAELVRQVRRQNLTLGRDVGILSFNETPLKEVLADGITVVSTDHEQMGRSAAQLMLAHRSEKIKNPFKLIRRASL